ncbi:PaaI family thioesterase [Oricola sp.]|uniref:PaaI family thioesterase n=1 Tax=Oricola sp. TaxID=1979950 RepID=UPI0025EC951A|nr:PaaI family thioesterase [Oricola sp.]MCI5075321.1 PaaI family thioesterase [Oricola sp.]
MPFFERRVRESFARQPAMQTMGGSLTQVREGHVEIELDHDVRLTQQHGFMHGGMVAAALDSACGYAALTLLPADAGVLTIEFKVNLLAPAKGERFRFEGDVVKPGRTITVVDGTAWALNGANTKRIATMTATMMTIVGREDVKD